MQSMQQRPVGFHLGQEPCYLEPLTSREQEVLALVAQGYSNREIAATLVVAEDTVRTHLRTIYAKLGITATSKSARIVAALRGKMLRYVGPAGYAAEVTPR